MNRLDILASLCKGSNIICDVGCDHGFVIINALKHYGVKKAIACDINKEPLNSCRINVLNYNLDDRVTFILSDGLKNVNLDFDTLVIAGMGGNLIVEILANSIEKIKSKKLIIEPNNHRELVRDFLTKNGFIIENEIALTDKGHYYEVMVFNEGHKEYSPIEIMYGPILIKSKPTDFVDYYKSHLDRLLSFQKNITNESKAKENAKLINDLKQILEA